MSEELTSTQEAPIPAPAAEATPAEASSTQIPAAAEQGCGEGPAPDAQEPDGAPAEAAVPDQSGEADSGDGEPAPAAEQPAAETAQEPVNTPEPAAAEAPAPKPDSGSETGPAPTPAPAPKTNLPPKKFVKKVVISDAERKEMWCSDLRKIGKFTDENFISAVVDYAMKNHGYDANRRWGGCLKVMINRVAQKCRDSLKTFTPADAEHIIKELERFLMEKPLGGNPRVWNEGRNNADQRDVISEFFGINCAFRQMRPENVCMTAIRDAAWPTIDEERKNTGGSFAERFHYLIMCIIRMCTTSNELQEGLFGGLYHNQPSDAFLERIGGGRKERRPSKPSWIDENGRCVDCESEVTKDEDGNWVCTNQICDHSIPVVSVHRGSNNRPHNNNRGGGGSSFVPSAQPADAPDRPRRNWKDKKDRRHNRDDREELPSGGKKRHGGKRWRVNDGDGEDFGSVGSGEGESGRTVATVGEEFQNNAFAGLTLPEPPPEQPVV